MIQIEAWVLPAVLLLGIMLGALAMRVALGNRLRP